MSGTILKGLHVIARLIHPVGTEVGAITISTLVLRTLRHREGKKLIQGQLIHYLMLNIAQVSQAHAGGLAPACN